MAAGRFGYSAVTGLLLMGAASIGGAQDRSADGAEEFVPPSSIPQHLAVVENRVYFSADDGVHGRELWCTDGTPEGTFLVEDIRYGYESSDPQDIQRCGDRLIFSAVPGSTRELVYVDLVTGPNRRYSVKLVKEINPEYVFGADPEFMGAAGRWTYFTANASPYGREVWRTDGTAEGTQLVKDIWPGPNSPSPGYEHSGRRAMVGDVLYFLAYWRTVNGVGEALPGLWRTDGTEEGTVCVGPVFEESEHLSSFGGRLFFSASDETHGREPWVSDGTDKGTRIFADLNPGLADSIPQQFTALGDRMIFQARHPQYGSELWISDGTPDGTHLVKDINRGAAHSIPYGFTHFGEGLLFSAETADTGRELWFTDGTEEGTYLVFDVWRGRQSSHPYGRCNAGGVLYFGANDGRHGEELWMTDGTPEGTRLVKDINPGAPFSEPHNFVNLNGRLVFVATDPVHGAELWISDGTEDGTRLLKDIYSEPIVNPSSSPVRLTFVGDRLFFVAHDIAHGAELWTQDPHYQQPRLVLDIFPGAAGSNPEELTAVDGMLFFRADDGQNGPQLWRSDGTEGGTVCVQIIANGAEGSAPAELTPGADGVYFVATHGETGRELWWGNRDGVRQVRDIRPGPESSMPRNLVFHDGKLYFSAADGVHGEELWFSNGLVDGTMMVWDIVPPPMKGAALDEMTVGPDGVYFTADDGYRGRQVWRSDGTREGTRLWGDLRPALLPPAGATGPSPEK